MFGRDQHPGGRSRETDLAEDDFIRSRAERLDGVTDDEIERIGADALATVDREPTLREADALHERWKVQPGQSAHSNRQ